MWSKWEALDTRLAYVGPAVYELRMVIGNGPIAIPRFLSCDNDGLLVIGETGSLGVRRNRLIRGLVTGRGHSEGNLLRL